MVRRAGTMLVVGWVLILLGGCGQSSSASSSRASGSRSTSAGSAYVAPTSHAAAAHFSKAEYVSDAGLALGGYQRWIYEAVANGTREHPGRHKAEFARASTASLFVFQQLKRSAQDVRTSRTLAVLAPAYTALATRVVALGPELTHGKANLAVIRGLSTSLRQVAVNSAVRGVPIRVQEPTVQQLTAGAG